MVWSGPVLNLKFILCIYGFLHILQYFNCIIYIYAGSCGPYAGQMVQTVKSSNLTRLVRNIKHIPQTLKFPKFSQFFQKVYVT
jgi:hypothetical protein